MMSLPALRAICQVSRVKCLVGGEESEVHVLQVLGKHALNEGGLFAHSLQLAERLFVIEQADIVAPGSCGR